MLLKKKVSYFVPFSLNTSEAEYEDLLYNVPFIRIEIIKYKIGNTVKNKIQSLNKPSSNTFTFKYAILNILRIMI